MPKIPFKPAEDRMEQYGGIEAQDPAEWWAPLNRFVQTIIEPLTAGRYSLVSILVSTIPGVQVKRPSGRVAIAANGGTMSSFNYGKPPRRVLGVEVWNFDGTNPLYLSSRGGSGGLSGEMYIPANQYYSADLSADPNTEFVLRNPASATVDGQICVNGF